ncbi:MAG: four helix bundle protein [Methylococcales bacterium]
MARYEHLPIYKQAMDVAVHFEKVVQGFSRYHKYTLGSELRECSRKVVAIIIWTNNEKDKVAGLKKLRIKLDELLVLIRLSKEVKAFKSFKSYQFIVEQVGSVYRQNEGWLKSVQVKLDGKQGGSKQSGSKQLRGSESYQRRRRSG